MKNLITLIAIALLSTASNGDDGLMDKSKQIAWGGFSWGAASVPDAIAVLTQQSLTACPSGFEKVREYAAPEGDVWFLHFVIRCLPPSKPIAAADK